MPPFLSPLNSECFNATGYQGNGLLTEIHTTMKSEPAAEERGILCWLPCALHAEKFENFWCRDCQMAGPTAFFQGLASAGNNPTRLHNLRLLLVYDLNK